MGRRAPHRFGLAALALASLTLGASGCGAALPSPSTESGAESAALSVKMLEPARLVPELDTDHLAAWFSEPGVERHLVGGMRVVLHDDGAVERASERFPSGNIQALPLPERLGGGFLFHQSDSRGTKIWRAESWTGKLTPLASLSSSSQEIVAGFDRIFVRYRSNAMLALDVETGAVMSRGRLPEAPRWGRMVFADGWRAVVDTDLRGPLVTFDAGMSWRPLGIGEPLNSATVIDGDPVLNGASAAYRIDAAGHVQLIPYDLGDAPPEDDNEPLTAPPRHPLGERPLRAILLGGWPDSNKSAVMVHEGKLFRVAVPSTEVLARTNTSIPKDASCQGALIGKGYGFICGEEDGPTTIYRATRPFGLAPFASFETPRFVASSGNGSLVVRGGCVGDGADAAEMRTYCILHADGTQREIAVRGEIGAERVVALKDGRVVVLIPPRFGRAGRITVIDGSAIKSSELSYPEEPRRAVKVARRGLWLEGFEERGKNEIGGWVEAGGPAVGVTVSLDGKVVPGKVYDEGGQVLVAGKLAVATSDAETGLESIDGGKTWSEFELPRLPEAPGDAKSRGCSPLGCAFRGWLRVGWGKLATEDDLEAVASPKAVVIPPTLRKSMKLDCQPVSAPADAIAHKPVGAQAPFSSWTAFLDTPPPGLAKDELGVDKPSQYYSDVGTHVYVWGAKGADWTRTGWWQIRFEDPFAVADAVRSSALTRSPWSDEMTASEAIGARHHGSYWRWEAALDPSGRAALTSLCTGSRCDHYAVSEGRSILELKSSNNVSNYLRPVSSGVARVGESWYLLTESHAGGALTLWRAELGTIDEFATFRRLYDRVHTDGFTTPQLVRRSIGADIGLMFTQPSDPAAGAPSEDLVVLPIDPTTKTLGAPILLGAADLDGEVPRRCAEHDDGWMLDITPSVKPDIELSGANVYLDEVRVRLRLDPGKRCIEGIAAKTSNVGAAAFATPQSPPTAAVPLALRERYSGRRWGFTCTAQ